MAATDGEEFVELPTGTLVARCDACGVVTDDEIREYVLAASDFQSLTTDLIEMANDRGGKDNISLLVAQDDALAPTPAALDTRAIEPDDIVDRETVLIPEDS